MKTLRQHPRRFQAAITGIVLAVALAALLALATPWSPLSIVRADDGETIADGSDKVLDLSLFTVIQTNGDYVAAGDGLRSSTSGSITIAGIPGGATVNRAYLYSGFLDNGESASLKSLTFAGTPIVGTLIGSGPDTCWLRTNSFAYRADVTSLVSGNGTYALTGVASGGAILRQGASLVVVYDNAGDPARDIVLLDGDDVLRFVGASVTNTISGFTAGTPVSAKTTYIVGDGQLSVENVSFTGGDGTSSFNNSLTGSDGAYWDTRTFDVSGPVAVGDTSATVNINIGGDCLMWVAQVFSVNTTTVKTLSLPDGSCPYEIKFNGVTLNTWSYTITDLNGQGCGLSHWVLSLCQVAFDAYVDSEPDPSGLVILDPGNTGLTGVKWNGIVDPFVTGTFTVTLSQSFPIDPDVDIGLKTGAGTVFGTMPGPSCEQGDPDLKKLDLQAIGPAEGPVSEQIFYDVVQVLHNNGPNELVRTLDIKEVDCPDQPSLTQCSVLIDPSIFEVSAKTGVPYFVKYDDDLDGFCDPPKIQLGVGPIQTDPAALGLAPGDCFVVDSVPGVFKELGVKKVFDLLVSQPVQDVTTFDVHCTGPSFHTLTIQDEIQPLDPTIVDSDPTNNAKETQYTIGCIAQADVKIVDFFCDAPPEIPVSVAVTIDCVKTLHNNGPHGPVAVQVVTTTFTGPRDCTLPQQKVAEAEQVLLPVSVPVQVIEQFTIHCFNPSFHDFIITNDISIKDLHVEDPFPGNNSASANFTVAAIAQADVKVTGVSVTCDDPVDVNTAFNCTVENTVHNNGPFRTVNADVTESLSGPPDCTLTPAGSQTEQDVSLPVSVPVVVSKTWSVTCTDRSFHTFSGSSDVQIDQLHVVDSDPTNNSGSATDTISVFDLADLKVTGVAVDCDDPVDTGDTFDCRVAVTVHSNGPTTPVSADVTVGLSVPIDCDDPADQTQGLSLVASVSTTVSKTFTTQCSLRSFHDFTGSADVQVDQLHVRDPDPNNNSGSGQDTNSVFDRADAKVTGVTIDCPATATHAVEFKCTVGIAVHNNGPLDPVDITGAANIGIA
ncbi:MAG: hypothetical protein IIA90_00725, partial [Chloroflexi bacterium]|nr:hypothetical protein [Chloroflexota bacterium]